MRTVDRDGIHIEQCTLCRGVFLDAGELEQIVAAEDRWGRGAPPPYESPGARPADGARREDPRRYADSPRPHRGGYQDSPRPYRGGGHKDSPPGYRQGYGPKRKRSFLESLFD